MLRLTGTSYLEMVAHAYDGLPEEACGLLLGRLRHERAPVFHACENAARSSRIYEIGGADFLRADRRADDLGLEIVGVMHSHTHTDAYPSPTDVDQAPVPEWHYVIVSLREAEPVLRSYRIVDGNIDEEVVVLDGR